MIRIYILLAGLSGLVGTPQSAAAQQTAAVGGDAARGRHLFEVDGCYECHGTVGQGGPGVRLAPSPIPASAIASYIRDPAGEMPPYTSKVVSDADVRDIHAYLGSIEPSRAWSTIPELNPKAAR